MRNGSLLIVCGAALTGLLSGCSLSVDPDLIRVEDSGADAQPEAMEPNDALVGDASVDGASDAASSRPDAHRGDDASFVSTPADAAVPSCTADSDCMADSYCALSAPIVSNGQGTCAPRCDSVRGCAGPKIERMSAQHLLNDGKWIYWSTASSADAAGNRLANGALWRWDGAAAPEIVVSNLRDPELIALDDGNLYFRDAQRFVHRAPVTVGSNAQPWVPLSANGYWFTAQHFWWSTNDDQNGTSTVWRRPRAAGGSEEKVLTSTYNRSWIGGTETLALAVIQVGSDMGLVATPLDGAADRQLAVAPFVENFGEFVVEPPYVYTTDVEGVVARVDMQNASRLNVAKLPVPRFATQFDPGRAGEWSIEKRGDWLTFMSVQVSSNSEQRQLIIGRAHANNAVAAKFLPAIAFSRSAQSSPVYAMMTASRDGRSVTYYHVGENRLFVLPMPAIPCSDSLVCPDTMTCKADQTCG